MLDFSRRDFNKAISLTVKKMVEVTSKWEIKQLGEIAEISKGKSITEKDTSPGNIKVIAGGIGYAYLHNTSNRPANVITVSASGANAGFVNYWEEKIFASDCTTIYNTDENLTFYIYSYLKSIQNEIFSLARGSAQPHVYPDDLKSLKIPFPPIDVQQNIVAECEIIDKAVKEAQQIISSAKEEIEQKVQTVLNDKYESKKLEDVAEIFSGGTPSTSNPNYWNGNINWVTLVDTKSKYIYDTERKISETGLKNSSAVLLPINSVIFSSRATIGSISISKIPVATNQGYKNFVCNPGVIDYAYLYYVLKFKTKEIESLAGGMTYKEISKTQLGNYKIPVPPLPVQQKLVEEIEILEAQIATAQNVIDNAAAQKQAILKKWLE